MSYTYSQLQTLWINAGGNPQYAPVAAAVALAESGGNPDATGPVGERGLWQIATSHGSLSTYDPLANARAAIQLSANGSTWRAWCTAYTDGACGTNGGNYSPTSGSPSGRMYAGATSLSGTTSPAPSGDGASPTVQSAGFFGIFDPQTWLHALDVLLNHLYYGSLVISGGILMFTGLYILMKESPTGGTVSTVTGAARKAIPLL